MNAKLYLELAKAYKENNDGDIAKYKAEIEKHERHKSNEDEHPLYSEKKGKMVSFADKVMEMNEAYDDLMFDLADNSNESMREIKTYTAGEVIRFNKRIVERMKQRRKGKQI